MNADEMRKSARAAKLQSYVAKVVAAAPPFSPAQADRVAILLRGCAEDSTRLADAA